MGRVVPVIGLVSAMAEELAAVIDVVHAEEVIEHGGRRYHRGRYAGEDVVCVISRIGKVAAATTVAILLERFRPRAVVMTGLAGGVDPRLAIGDIVIADTLIQHDLDARPLFPRHEIPLLGIAQLPADPALADRLARAAERFIVPPEVAALGITAPRVWRGLIASGDQFFSSSDAVAALRVLLPDTLAVEMEGAAVAQVCHEHGIPFAVARVISDTADHGAALDFARFLRDACGPYARALVEGVLTGVPSGRG
ncbi:MAG: 5-methylthioadenosine/S-adenosylhomocysteine nucleosidase [Myxococcales bacterium]|nr:5-methylthioadenosine/S-adenosylhomocysteine nucleosidase [Myxococcales bacterium]